MTQEEVDQELNRIYEEEEMNKKERDNETMNRLRNIEIAVKRIEDYIKGGGDEEQGSEGVEKDSGAKEEDQK